MHKRDILDKLFGDPVDLTDGELDTLYSAIEPNSNPGGEIRKLAEAAAAKYRLQNKKLPDHVQAALNSCGIRDNTEK